jgi:hypothetical protein
VVTVLCGMFSCQSGSTYTPNVSWPGLLRSLVGRPLHPQFLWPPERDSRIELDSLILGNEAKVGYPGNGKANRSTKSTRPSSMNPSIRPSDISRTRGLSAWTRFAEKALEACLRVR